MNNIQGDNSKQQLQYDGCTNRSHRWVVSASQAQQLISQGATVLDVRNIVEYLFGHIPGAVRVAWQQFSQQQPSNKGKLIADKILEQIRAIGIDSDKPVIVIGNPTHIFYFGEDGRIVWMLRTLGHNSAFFVDGGYAALINGGAPKWGISPTPKPGNFVVKRTALWEIERDELQANLVTKQLIVIDTRSPQEYAGATLYGEKRGGHVPGAVHFYFKDLIDADGKLLKEQILAKLESLKIQSDTPIAAYCTGGVRSAFFVAVLADLGFTNVRNYAGSMWEWSDAIADTYPLTKS